MSTERLRVGHVVTNLHDGGIEQMIFEQVRHLPKESFDVRLYALTSSNPWRRRFEELGARVRTYRFENRPNICDAPAFILELARLSTDLRDDDLDILQLHDFFPAVTGRIAGILAGTPRMIATLHNTYTWLGKTHGAINRLLALRTSDVVGVSNACIGDSMARDHIPSAKYRLIYNGVDATRFKPRPQSSVLLRTELGWPEDSLVLCNIGTVSERKRQSDLVAAFDLLAAETPELRLLIVGSRREHENEIHSALTHRIASSPYRTRIAILSERKDVEMLLSGSDIYCMPSRVEGFGIALVEAMMSGLPVACTDIPAFREIVENGVSGLLFPVGDVIALAEALRRLVQSAQLRMSLGETARAEALGRFSDSTMGLRYRELFQEP